MNKDFATSYQQLRWENTLKSITRNEEAIEKFKPYLNSDSDRIRITAEDIIKRWEASIEKEKSKYPQYFK